jgi:phospholipid-transporting ATPase
MMSMANDYLKKFANDGNRTLAFASRRLTPEQFIEWKNAFTEAQVSLEGREKKIEAAFALLENNMTLNGCTSVEDPLQDGVPNAIDSLVHAQIVVVVLTGDKQETAVAIGKASKIIQADATLHYVVSEDSKQLEAELQALNDNISANAENHHALVIGGNSLEVAINYLSDLFLQVLPRLQTVVCSRATPSQKAAMVTLVKTRLKKICLAIGDGANDVSMIQKANVGVGLTGKEGTQAAQSADFVLHRFRHLPRLLFVHGRFSYIRMCKTVYWSFYKNTFFPFPLVFFGIFSSWSDMPFYDSYLMNLFNVVYTSLPPLVIGWTEKDELEQELMNHPETYPYFRANEKFTVWKFVQYLFFGVLQSCVVFWIGYGLFYDNEVIYSDGKGTGVYVFGQWLIIATIIIINVTFLMWTSNWTRAMVGCVSLGIVVLLLTLVILSWWISVDADMYGMTNYIFPVPMQYIYLAATCALCVVPAYLQVAYENRPKNYVKH